MFQVDVDYLKKAKKRREVAPTVITIVLAFAGVISALPIVYLFVTAFKPAEELFLYPPRFYVANPTLKNFSDLVSITRADTTGDLRYCKVYLSVLGQLDEKEFKKGLKSAAPWLRRELGRSLDLRYTPELIFELDKSIEHGAHISALIEKLEIPGEENNDADAD